MFSVMSKLLLSPIFKWTQRTDGRPLVRSFLCYHGNVYSFVILVGCIEDLRRFSGISAISRLESGRFWNSSDEAGNRTPDLLLRKPRALNHSAAAAPRNPFYFGQNLNKSSQFSLGVLLSVCLILTLIFACISMSRTCSRLRRLRHHDASWNVVRGPKRSLSVANLECKIQKNWSTVAIMLEYSGGHSWTPWNHRWDQVSGRSRRVLLKVSNILLIFWNIATCSTLL